MNKIIAVIAMLATATGLAHADSRTVTFCSDGAIVEIEAAATKGTAEIRLPPGMMPDSLRIKPLNNAVVQRVDIVASRSEGKGTKDLDALFEQKSRLEDRLQALATREEIFKAAAKSQSGKAPRKTKANPEPMQTIRQGTDFAIAQLEAVYTARRKTEQEVRRCDARIAALKKAGQGGESVAMVSVSPKNGRFKVRYVLEREGWSPRYDLRLESDGKAHLTLYGQLPDAFGGYLLQASPASLADNPMAKIYPASAGLVARLAELRLPVSAERYGQGMRSSFSFVLNNAGGVNLPAGEADFYRNGEYWGRFRFEGISSGRSRRITSGM